MSLLQERANRGELLQLLPAIAVGLVTAVVGFAALHAPPSTGEMGVVFPPWTDQRQVAGAIIAAGGRIVESSRLPNVMIAYALDEDFGSRVRREGAWFTVAARGLCAPATPRG